MRNYTIYKHPADYPNHYVMRVFIISPLNVYPTDEFYLADSLEKIRAFVPAGCVCTARDANDSLSIFEIWV